MIARRLLVLACLSACFCPASAQAQRRGRGNAEAKPTILLASPLGVPAGATTKVVLRGSKIEGATEIKTGDEKITAKILGQGKAAVPNMQNAAKIGDLQVEIEVTVPADAPPGEMGLVLVTPQGETASYALFVGGEAPLIEEKEPNDGFRQAQAIAHSQTVHGSIHADRNVDCYAIDGSAGQKLVCELFAARRGSALDGVLSLYNERSILIATSDDHAGAPDPRIETTLPSAGKYFLVVQDAHDVGGPAHPYRLVVTEK